MAEYAEILSGKKAAYADCRKARDEAQELLIALRNIEFLYDVESKEEQQQHQEEKAHWHTESDIGFRWWTVPVFCFLKDARRQNQSIVESRNHRKCDLKRAWDKSKQ